MGAGAWAQAISGDIKFQSDTVHVELSGRTNWDYDLKRREEAGKTFVEMRVPALDTKSLSHFANFKSPLVSSVIVDTKGPDGQAIIKFELAQKNIETFDYLTDQPSRLVVDFFVSPNSEPTQAALPTKLPKKVEKPVTKTKNSKAAQASAAKASQNRKPANTDVLQILPGEMLASNVDTVKAGIFDGGDPDYDRFSVKDYQINEESFIRAQDNYYIPFPMLETPVASWEKLKISPNLYEISPKSSEENKQARLLLTLFEKERYAVFLKTQKWFREKYPHSPYLELVDYMTADVHLALWQKEQDRGHFDEALQKYKEAVQKYPQSPMHEKTSLKIGYLALERGDYLSALRLFNQHIENTQIPQDSYSKGLAKVGMGLAYTNLNRWEEAHQAFDELENKYKNRDLQVEGAFRKGDVWLKAKNFKKSTEAYQAAIKKFPEGSTDFPSAYYNQAEALFWQKEYIPSLNVFRESVKKFPQNEHAPFAMTRLGELLEIFGADSSKVMGAYLETYFRFGESPKAVVARLHLLSARMKGMKSKEVKNAVQEIMNLATKIDLPNIQQFATVMVADGYNHRGEYQEAIDLLSEYYKKNPTTVDVDLITNHIIANINEKLAGEIQSGDFIKALRTHDKYADSWLKHSKRLDTKYNVGRAFEMAGVPTEAEKYYQAVLNRVYSIHGTKEALEVKAKEHVPSQDELNLRLASISSTEKKHKQAYEYLNAIKSPEKMSEPNQVERVDIAVRLLEQRGDTDSAIRYLGELLKTWKGQPQLVAGSYLKLADLQMKKKKNEEAVQALEMVDKLAKDAPGQVKEAEHAKALETLALLQSEAKNWDKAIQAYDSLLAQYEDKRPLSSMRYKLGQIYFDRGQVQKASEVWASFKDQDKKFWQDLAQEQLKNAEWRDDYKKYIQRIPAMSVNEKSE